jgi:outer membrane protein TolC
MKVCLGARLQCAPESKDRIVVAPASTTRRAARIARLLLMVAAVAAAQWTTSVLAQTSLTLAEAQRRAVERSGQLAAQASAAASAREMAVAAGQLPDPIATAGINNLPINGPDAWSLTQDFMTMASVGVMQEFTRTEKREARAQRYEVEAQKFAAERSASIASIRRDVAVAWLERYYAESMASVVAEQSRQAQAEIVSAENAYRAGRGSLADVLAAHSALVGLEDRGSEIGRRVGVAKIALARWIGPLAEAPLGAKPAIDAIDVDPRAVDAELERQPQIAVLSRQQEMAAAEVRLAEANKKSDWSVSLMYSQRGPAYSNMISVNVSVPLQWDQRNRQDRELASKLALLDQARAEREDMLRARAAELRAMIAEWDNDRERLARYEQELLPLASERTQATLAAYRGAKASISDVLLARRNEIDIRVQALQLEADTARLWAQLNFVMPEEAAGSTKESQ